MSAQTAPCTRHPDQRASHACETCGGQYCVFCVTRRPRPDVMYHECPVCAGKGKLSPAKVMASASNLAAELKSVFSYPVANGGWMVLLAAGIMGGIMAVVLRVGGMIVPFFAIPIGLAMFGYVWMYLLRVVGASADGEDELPDWPPWNGMSEFIFAALGLFALLVFCALPAGLAFYWGLRDMTTLLVLTVLGMTYFPMAMLALGMGGGWSTVSPLIIIPSIVKVGRGYWIAVAALVGIMFVRMVVQRTVGDTAVGGLIMSLMGLYFLVAQARVVGLLYRVYGPRLGWFD